MVVYLFGSLAFALALFTIGGMWLDRRIDRIIDECDEVFLPAWLLIMGSVIAYLVTCSFFFDWMARFAGVHHG